MYCIILFPFSFRYKKEKQANEWILVNFKMNHHVHQQYNQLQPPNQPPPPPPPQPPPSQPLSQHHYPDYQTTLNQWSYQTEAGPVNSGNFNITSSTEHNKLLQDVEEFEVVYQQKVQKQQHEERAQASNAQSTTSQSKYVKELTCPSNFLDKDIEIILASTPFLKDEIPQQIKGDYHITSETLSENGVQLNGIKITSWNFQNLMSDSDFEDLLDIFKNSEELIEGKNLSKKRYIQRIQLLGLLINLNWKIQKPAMQVKVWRLMERKLACRKAKMTNKHV